MAAGKKSNAKNRATGISRETSSILGTIGDTTLLELHKIVPEGHARIFLKLENENPTGSMKDRTALAMVEAAEADGRLSKGGTVVEYTGGSAGVSLSLVCAVKGYALSIVTSDAFSIEKRGHMQSLGAELTIIPSDDGGMTEALTRQMVETANKIAARPGNYLTDQLHNVDQIAAHHRLGEEIWSQTEGRVDAFVQSVGTAASVRGVGEALRRHKQDVIIVAVEPSESAVLSGAKSGSHKIEGVGAGFVVPLWNDNVADDIQLVSTEAAMAMARRLAREEGLFAGTSTGGNVVAALDIAKRLGPDAIIVTLMVDSGIKYLSTELYNRS